MRNTIVELRRILQSKNKVTLLLAAVNVVVFLVLSAMGNTESAQFMYEHGASFTPDVMDGAYWRLFTCMFLHFGLPHLAYNMLCLVSLGDMLEKEIGSFRYAIVYLAGGFLGNVVSTIWELHTGRYAVSAGASGAVFAVIGAMLYLVILGRGRMGRISLRRMGLMTVLMLGQGFTEAGTDNAAHLGGFAAGLVLCVLLYHSSILSGGRRNPRIRIR